MMFGGGLMMGIGLLFMLSIIVIPILLVVASLGGTFGFMQNQNRASDVVQRPIFTTSSPIVRSEQEELYRLAIANIVVLDCRSVGHIALNAVHLSANWKGIFIQIAFVHAQYLLV